MSQLAVAGQDGDGPGPEHDLLDDRRVGRIPGQLVEEGEASLLLGPLGLDPPALALQHLRQGPPVPDELEEVGEGHTRRAEDAEAERGRQLLGVVVPVAVAGSTSAGGRSPISS